MIRNICELARGCILAAETEDKPTLTRAAVRAWNDATALSGDCDPPASFALPGLPAAGLYMSVNSETWTCWRLSLTMVQGMRHGRIRKPLHPDARAQAGFSAEELQRLQQSVDS